MDAQILESPFAGTPWKNDQEIYDYANHRIVEKGWDWDQVKAALVNEGLNSDYADAIIENLKVATVEVDDVEVDKSKKKRKYISWGLSILFAVIVSYFLTPLAYVISPTYGRMILIIMISGGLTLIRNYKEGK